MGRRAGEVGACWLGSLAWCWGQPQWREQEKPPGKGSEPFEDVRLVTEGRKATVDDKNYFCFA